jgi:hypothetical protein
MIAEHQEPRGLSPNAAGLACEGMENARKRKAERGSAKLLEAIIRAHRKAMPPQTPPAFKVAPLQRSGRPRKRGRKPSKRLCQAVRIIELVAEHANLTSEELAAKDRRWNRSHPRQVAMYLIRLTTGSSYPSIGKYFGGKDHTTIMHGIREVQGRIATNDKKTIAAMRFVHERLRG